MSTIPKDFPLKSAVLAHGEVDGIAWVAARAPIYQAVNGYCRVPDGHPWLTVNESYRIENTVPWGEITYRSGNWVGFDSCHAGQRWPAMTDWGLPLFDGDTLMTDEMVIGWAQRLAGDAAAALAEGGQSARAIGSTRFCKKPVEIEAMRLVTGFDSAAPILHRIRSGGGTAYLHLNCGGRETHLLIRTLEGDMIAALGDYVIRGVQGEFYPCKPDIFEATYVLADGGEAA